jgi:hypothetical protein
MGTAADLKVTEIEETRRLLEDDLRELESRLPAPLRSAKSAAGLVVGSTVLTAFILRKLRSKRSNGQPTAEVVVRIVRDDAQPAKAP